jgi:hypothetical protein
LHTGTSRGENSRALEGDRADTPGLSNASRERLIKRSAAWSSPTGSARSSLDLPAGVRRGHSTHPSSASLSSAASHRFGSSQLRMSIGAIRPQATIFDDDDDDDFDDDDDDDDD